MFRSASMNLGAVALPGCQAILCFINIVLQLVSLPPSYWGTYIAKTDQGAILERGHFGLWYVCSQRVPFFFEDCEAPITYLRLTGLSTAAGALAIIHLLILFGALPLIVIRLVQSIRNIEDGCLDVRFLCLAKTTVTVVALILAVIVVILGSMGTDQPAYYEVQQGWAFWVQVVILIIDIFLVLVGALENIQLWKLQNMQEAANTGTSSYQDDFSETYSNPGFGRQPVYDVQQRAYDTELPAPPPSPPAELEDSDFNGSTAGLPPPPPLPPPGDNDNGYPEPDAGSRNGADLTYQNPTFEDSSPSTQRRTANNEPRYGNL
ncbi:uncharacterized protein LOC142564177 [Dermacentor variabilis]|uniref:uncharacterized protein LOC142564177 n=1 Tax=Dermacentor variabilis TaxID=34621 RepID=UPI003F5B6277